MSKLLPHLVCCVFVLPIVIFGAGCRDLSLPAFLPLDVPSGGPYSAPIGSGIPSLAGTTWAAYPMWGNPNAPKLHFEFGPEGELRRAFDNRAFAADIIGDTFIVDGELHSTLFPGSSYIGESYASEQGSFVVASGFGKFFVGPFQAACATARVSGTLNDAKDRIDGTLSIEFIDIDPVFADVIEDLFGQAPEILEWDVYALKENQSGR